MRDDFEARLKSLEDRLAALEGRLLKGEVRDPPKNSKRDQQSVGEYLLEKRPASGPDRVLCLAVFNESSTGRQTFDASEILSLWRTSREKPASNINDLINKNIAKGFIAEDTENVGGKKRWYVTRSGLTKVEQGFGKAE